MIIDANSIKIFFSKINYIIYFFNDNLSQSMFQLLVFYCKYLQEFIFSQLIFLFSFQFNITIIYLKNKFFHKIPSF